ncbi:hypothetical protein LSAT2_014519 [Lamellibrachia satsuma]|nr:hypothetical protein LSAT2_014519 [Lamellibrachia satsuma]
MSDHVTVQAPAKVEYPRIDKIPRTPAFDDTDFNMTCTVSGSGDVKVQWLKDEVSVDSTAFAVTTVQVTDGQYMYGQTSAKNSTLVWQVTKKTRYLTCNNITHFDGHYTCAVTTETASAMTHDVSKAFIVNVQCPARAPLKFTVLNNHTSVALTLQWRPGFDGGYPPQTFTLQYRASNEVALGTWSNIFIYTTDETTWHQATVTGLQPQTQYVFSLYAENSQPRNRGPNRSLTITQMGSTTASPNVTIQSVRVEVDRMTIKWSYNGQSSRHKRSTSTNVSVVIYYQPDGGEAAHYPLEGSVAAEERQVTINGQFDNKVKYKVWLKVFEGHLVVSSQQTKAFEAAVKITVPPPMSGSTPVAAIATSVATVVVILIAISLIALLLYRRHAKNNILGGDACHVRVPVIRSSWRVHMPRAGSCRPQFLAGTHAMQEFPPSAVLSKVPLIDVHCGSESQIQSHNKAVSTTQFNGDNTLYESLTEGHTSNERSAHEGTYMRLDNPVETTGGHEQGSTYEEIDTSGQPKHTYVNANHTYVNTALVGGDTAEYQEVNATIITQATQVQSTYQNIRG